jgi:hypothetical protein
VSYGAEKRLWPAGQNHSTPSGLCVCCERFGRQNHRTLSGLCVCCERALKSAGERNTHGGGRCGDLRETACTGGCGSCTTSKLRRFGGGGYPLLANC